MPAAGIAPELHDVRAFLGPANLTATSRYLRSTALRLERALRLLEHAQGLAPRAPLVVREGDVRTGAPHQYRGNP